MSAYIQEFLTLLNLTRVYEGMTSDNEKLSFLYPPFFSPPPPPETPINTVRVPTGKSEKRNRRKSWSRAELDWIRFLQRLLKALITRCRYSKTSSEIVKHQVKWNIIASLNYFTCYISLKILYRFMKNFILSTFCIVLMDWIGVMAMALLM